MKKKAIPTKAELLRLQKLYKTDEKIGERLGGVAAYLVAYWRRKKNIAKYSLPKFSEAEIRNLWERYGDDEKAGLELGISKAAFYNWRRRYGLREKPAFLKLEQLELNFPGMVIASHANSLYGQRSVAQKILARLADTSRVEIGQDLEVEPDMTVTACRAGEVVREFKKNSELVWNPGKIILMLDHAGSVDGESPADGHRRVREFARRQGIKTFYDLREGTCNQLALERGQVVPGRLLVGTGQSTAAFGAMSTLAMAVDPTTMGGIWSGAGYRLTVPETVRVVIAGRRARGVSAVDIALHVVKQLAADDLSGKVIEYAGSAVSQMSIGERFAFSTLAVLTGAAAAVCAYDATTRRYLTGRTMTRYQPVIPDKDAGYSQVYQINIDQLTPQIVAQNSPAGATDVGEKLEMPVQQIVLGSCLAGRFEDLRVAAEILKGKQVHEGCRLNIIPGSRAVYLEALKKGLIRVFIEAGAVVVHPGCRSGSADGGQLLADAECCLTTSYLAPRETDVRAGADIYLCSSATAAASALNGAVTDPTRYGR